MIVSSMTLKEIHDELHEEIRNSSGTIENRVERFRNIVLKSKKFPVRKYYECKSIKKKTRFFIQLTALKRGEFRNPIINYYCIYDRREGLYCADVLNQYRMTVIYPPHFFSRYRERLIRDGSLSAVDLIHLYEYRNWGISAQSSITTKNDTASEIEQINTIGWFSDGMLLGNTIGNILLIKTFLPEHMLNDNQREVANDLKKRYHEMIHESFPGSIGDIIIASEKDYVRDSDINNKNYDGQYVFDLSQLIEILNHIYR